MILIYTYLRLINAYNAIKINIYKINHAKINVIQHITCIIYQIFKIIYVLMVRALNKNNISLNNQQRQINV